MTLRVNSAHYQSYLLRLWREGNKGDWRVSLEDIRTGERKYFADLAEMFVYLCGKIGRRPISTEARTPPTMIEYPDPTEKEKPTETSNQTTHTSS